MQFLAVLSSMLRAKPAFTCLDEGLRFCVADLFHLYLINYQINLDVFDFSLMVLHSYINSWHIIFQNHDFGPEFGG